MVLFRKWKMKVEHESKVLFSTLRICVSRYLFISCQ